MQYRTIAYDGKHINIVCEGWERVDGFYYRELRTTEGTLYLTTLTYRLKNDDSSLRY